MGKEGWATLRPKWKGRSVSSGDGGLQRSAQTGKEPGKHGQHGQLGWDLRFGAAEGVWGRVSGKRAGEAVGPLRRKGGESWWNVVHAVGA